MNNSLLAMLSFWALDYLKNKIYFGLPKKDFALNYPLDGLLKRLNKMGKLCT